MGDRRWFHPHISGIDAEKLLIERGFDGSFLVRPSKSSPGNFTLSVRVNDEVTHIKIQNTGDDGYDLYGGEKFATLAELVQNYTEKRDHLKQKNGEIIELRQPLYFADPITERWFHGHISGKEAEELLVKNGKQGSFLVRASQKKLGDYVLSIMVEQKVTHVMINYDNGKYDVAAGGETFDTVPDLVERYKNMAMVAVGGAVVQLKQPFNTTRINALRINNRVKELEKRDSTKVGFWEEFEHLQLQEWKYLYDRKEGQKLVNKSKNRYKHILPFDHSRICLRNTDPDIEGSDYINANLIVSTEDDSSHLSYIAAQGCLHQTVPDFWNMVWQKKCKIIVMTTKLMERGKNKCAQYWPKEEEGPKEISLYKGKLLIKPLSERPDSNFILRKFELIKDEKSRVVYQYHFTAWPDHGVPHNPRSVLDFLQKINDKQEKWNSKGEEPSPILVHCSAGIGRTGTFVVIDMILKKIKAQGLHCEIDIQKIIKMVRGQRSGMVQTEAQYKFVYTAVVHYVDTLKQELKQRQISGGLYANVENPVGGASGGALPADVSNRGDTEISNTYPRRKLSLPTPGYPFNPEEQLYQNMSDFSSKPQSNSKPALPRRRSKPDLRAKSQNLRS